MATATNTVGLSTIWTQIQANQHCKGRITPKEQPENPFSQLIPDQEIAIIPSYELESGVVLTNFPVAYKTYGQLSPERDNAMVIFHALSGSADVKDWWGPLLGGPGDEKEVRKAFDMSRFFVICVNSLGSPYGSASPVTATDGDTAKGRYGPEFPLTTIRDDVQITKLVLDDLGVKQVATVIGGSMGGMLTVEFAYLGKDYVRTIIPIACSARFSAWGIAWGEAQRQAIYSDPKYQDGYYAADDPPATGLGAARMQGMLTYRSRDSFETKFSRNTPDISKKATINTPARPQTPDNEHFRIHNEGHKNAGSPRNSRSGTNDGLTLHDTTSHLPSDPNKPRAKISTYYSAQSYLRYQGDKFIKRYDANCYIAITRKMDTHDVTRNRTDTSGHPSQEQVNAALAMIEQPALILGIKSDGLFTYAEQQELAAAIPNSELKTIESPEGHDAFLLEFRQVNEMVLSFMKRELTNIMEREPVDWPPKEERKEDAKASTFGEAEVEDITAW